MKFKNNEFIPKRMYRQFTFEDSLSKAGGLIGLLAGASILSLIELLYFFSLEMGSMIVNISKKIIKRKHKKQHKILMVQPVYQMPYLN